MSHPDPMFDPENVRKHDVGGQFGGGASRSSFKSHLRRIAKSKALKAKSSKKTHEDPEIAKWRAYKASPDYERDKKSAF